MRRVVGTSAIALIVGLAGCSGGGDKPAQSLPPTATSSSDPATVVPPPGSSAASPSASPTASAQPTKPTLPATARQHSRAGAKAMAEYWLYAWDYALSTGNTKPMWAVSKQSCQACAKFGSSAEAVLKAGGTITAVHPVRLLGAAITAYSPNAQIRLSYITGQNRITVPSQHINELSDPPTRTHSRIALTWNAKWVVDDMYVGQ